jgi:hypothetical protein
VASGYEETYETERASLLAFKLGAATLWFGLCAAGMTFVEDNPFWPSASAVFTFIGCMISASAVGRYRRGG